MTITTSNGISVRQGGIRSALGRIGFNLGKDIDEKTNIYLKANLLHNSAAVTTLRWLITAAADKDRPQF